MDFHPPDSPPSQPDDAPVYYSPAMPNGMSDELPTQVACQLLKLIFLQSFIFICLLLLEFPRQVACQLLKIIFLQSFIFLRLLLLPFPRQVACQLLKIIFLQALIFRSPDG